MKTLSHSPVDRLVAFISSLLFLVPLLAACGGPPSTGGQGTPTPGKTISPGRTATSEPTTVPMPPTQTNCPSVGTARAAVMAPLVRGSHANVVYEEYQGQFAHPIAGLLKRYDTTTRRTTVMVTEPHTEISDAQVSADGQWVVFATSASGRFAIQLVRMYGQGLQTLYCSTSSESVWDLEWSPDQKYLAFNEGDNLYLLTMATGAYRLEAPGSSTKGTGYLSRTWLDSTHLYLTPIFATETPPLLHLSLLDISTAKIQQVLTLQALCADFDSSIDGRQLFTSECQFAMPTTEGPSRIRVQPATGGSASTIHTSPTYAITSLRVASRTSLLFTIHNTGVGSIDRSHNGLWKINTDGTGLTRLSSEAADETTFFNTYTQYVWSTVSRDGGTYAVMVIKHPNSSSRIFSLLVGSMNGGTPEAFVTRPDTTGSVSLVGWTSM